MNTISRYNLLLIVVIALLAACSAPTPAPTPTTVPTEPPTSTPVPLTATPVPTNTPIPPTDTPAPTATPRPTNTPAPTATPRPSNTPTLAPTKVVTPNPTNTKSAAAVSTGGGVSSKPSNLATSIEQVFNAARGIVGHFNEMLNGGGVEVCAPLIAKYQGIHNAPTYDVTGQPAEVQNAYAAYRNGINIVDTLAEKILSCGQNGVAIGAMDLGPLQRPIGQAVDSFGQAMDTIKLAPGVSTLSPLEDAIVRTLRAVGSVGDSVNQLMPNQWEPANKGIAADDPRCVQAITAHNSLPNFTMDPAGQPAAVQTAYQLYQEAMNLYQVEVSNFPKACAAGEVTVAPVAFGTLSKNIRAVLDKLYKAQAVLK